MYSLSDFYHVAKSFSHVTRGKVIEDFHLPEVGKPPISPVILTKKNFKKSNVKKNMNASKVLTCLTNSFVFNIILWDVSVTTLEI